MRKFDNFFLSRQGKIFSFFHLQYTGNENHSHARFTTTTTTTITTTAAIHFIFLSYLKLAIPVRFKIAKALICQDSKTLKHFGCSSKMTSSCSKWPINLLLYYNLFIIYIFSCHNLLCFTGCAPYWWRYSRKEYCKPYEPAICKYTHAGASRVRFV